MKSLSRIRLLATPWTAAHQAPPSMGFSRQEYRSGVPLPSPTRVYCTPISVTLVVIVTAFVPQNIQTSVSGTTTASCSGASLVAQTIKNLPAMWETGVRSLGWEDPLEMVMATYSSILAWRILWTERSMVGYSPWGCKESNITERLTLSLSLSVGFLPHCVQTCYACYLCV